MGADMRLAVETHRGREHDPWDAFVTTPICIDRDYALFGLLNGVRNWDSEPLFAVRGMPPDFDRDILDDFYEDCGHMPSWLTTSEAGTVAQAYREKVGKSNVQWEAVVAMMQIFETAGIRARVLFACDQG